ncbi:MAG: ionic transporter y4hA [Alcaligenaceae bacterium]|nr:ionic transporter y4hA [Alcaligenaceae bacterium]
MASETLFVFLQVLVISAVLIGVVLIAVKNADVVAERVGQPFGTIILALAVTVIEVVLITTILFSDAPGAMSIVRDSLLATIMICMNGIMGICILMGALKFNETIFRADGTNSTLSILFVLSILVLVLPDFTTTIPGPFYDRTQLLTCAIACLTMWFVYFLSQTRAHRIQYTAPRTENAPGDQAHPHIPTNKKALIGLVLMLIALTAVVLLAKLLAPKLEQLVTAIGAGKGLVGILVAFLCLLPESGAAIAAAKRNQLQISFNLALGSSIASLGLTIPVVACIALAYDFKLVLGIDSKSIVFLLMSFVLCGWTVHMGRANFVQAAAHLMIFVSYISFMVVP